MNGKMAHFVVLFILLSLLTGCGGGGGGATASRSSSTDGPIIFTTAGASFAPVLTVEQGATVTWTWSDGSTSNSATPAKSFGSAASRTQTLTVTPWSALKGINVGYDAADDGDPAIPLVPPQDVTAIDGIAVAAPYLELFCASYSRITSLNFDNFVNLKTIEVFKGVLSTLNLKNTSALTRLNVEENDLTALDVSSSPNLADIRASLNLFPTIIWGDSSKQWHICIRDNAQMTDRTMFADLTGWPVLQHLWIWNTNQTGTLKSTSDTLTSVRAHRNSYTSADFTGAFIGTHGSGELLIYDNRLTSLILAGCPALVYVDAHNNKLSAAAIDTIVQTLDSLGTQNGTLNLLQNAPPSATGRQHIENLRGKGWSVQVEG